MGYFIGISGLPVFLLKDLEHILNFSGAMNYIMWT